MDGLEATRAIRRFETEHEGESATIIALTGLSGDADFKKIQEAGCNGILTKPYSKRQFLHKMKEVLKIP
jgi:CheY-like chemotaxis protein